jgi:transcription elongation GreA/GreB family factor
VRWSVCSRRDVSHRLRLVFTANGFQTLKAEHALRIERETLVERMRSALELGGAPRENGVYLDARHEFELLERRLSLLDERLARAEVIAPRNDWEVDLGERVTVVDMERRGDGRLIRC